MGGVVAACNPEWQLVVARSRFAGLRAPPEVFSLRRADVGPAAGRMPARPPKSEHHPNGASRVAPVFPHLRPHLVDASDRAAGAGAAHVTGGVGERGREKSAGKAGWNAVNLSAPFDKMVARAGLEPWPKSPHNARASPETDLMRDHPIHAATARVGDTPEVAPGHDLRTPDSDFAKALAGVAESGALSGDPAESASFTPVGDRRENATNRPVWPSVTAPDILSNTSQTGRGGTRTRTPVRAEDFKSSVSAIPPLARLPKG